jgi:ribosomal protein S18 acetylase RimI-like enzyme
MSGHDEDGRGAAGSAAPGAAGSAAGTAAPGPAPMAAGTADAPPREQPSDLRLRRPVPDDHPRVVAVIDEWWGGRRMSALLPRLWFEHFSGTSWIAEDAGGRLLGFLVAFVSADDPDTAYIHMVGADPNRRRGGIGRTLYERSFEDLAARGARRVTCITWPGNRISIAFHRSLGFRIDDGPGTTPIYGTPAHPDHDGPGDDRVVFIRDLEGRRPPGATDEAS